MIIHEDIGVQAEAKAFGEFGEEFQEMAAVGVVGKDGAAFDAAGGHVIPGAGDNKASGPSHIQIGKRQEKERSNVKC